MYTAVGGQNQRKIHGVWRNFCQMIGLTPPMGDIGRLLDRIEFRRPATLNWNQIGIKLSPPPLKWKK